MRLETNTWACHMTLQRIIGLLIGPFAGRVNEFLTGFRPAI